MLAIANVTVWLTSALQVSATYMSRFRRYMVTREFVQLANLWMDLDLRLHQIVSLREQSVVNKAV